VVGYAMGFFPDPSRLSPYEYDISVTAHELGHNSGTGHTHDSPNFIDTCDDPATTPQRGTIMSYCAQTWSGGNSNRDLYFHSRIQQNMDAHIGGASCVVDDCNQNGIADNLDIQQSTSPDVNSNGIPDECEDCNGNLVLDDADIALATSIDVDGDGIPDECEPDCNGNLVPDHKDIVDATSTDLFGNVIPDECEVDCDIDGLSDYSEIQADMTLDVDRSIALDACQDCDTDGTIDLDLLGQSHHAWVASGEASSAIREFHGNTGVLTALSAGGAGALADQAQDLIITPGDRVLVSSLGDSRIMEFDLDGNYLGDLVDPGAGGLISPTGMTLTPDGGTLLVASSGTNSVLAYAVVAGTALGEFVAAGSGGLSAPFGMIFGPGGNLLVTSAGNEVLEYGGQNGSFVRVFVSSSDNGGLDQARGVAFKPDGNLLVASFGTDQVLEYDGQTGAALGVWARSGTASALTQVSPWGIRVGPNGNIFVVRTGDGFGSGAGGSQDHDDHGELHLSNAQIYEFDARNGNFLRTYIGGNDHGLQFPTGFDFVSGWGLDCNLNFLPDSCDITLGFSDDLDSSAIPDECEVDCNASGTFDRLDIIPYGTSLDCNNNLSPDSCDLNAGISADCSGNGIPDECEPDCNGNLVADSCDINAGTSTDCNGNGIVDECDVADDFELVTGWTSGAPGDTATTGIWTRVDPIGTAAQPEEDHTPGTGSFCFVTGQGTVGGALGQNDVDGGQTTLLSPALDLSSDAEAKIGYWRWFSNSTGGNPGQDTLEIDISNDGGQNWTSLETVGPGGPEASGGWLFSLFRVADFLLPTNNVVLRFIAADTGGGSIVEAAIDDLVIIAGCCQTNQECDDGLSCTSDTCSLSGQCSYTLAPASCLISGACYDDGDLNPSNDCEECDSASWSSWSPSLPVEVEGVVVSQGGPTHLTWMSQGNGFAYDLVGGPLAALQSSGGASGAQCLTDDLSTSNWDDPRPDPAVGEGYYYLLRSQKSCGFSTYGLASSGAERLPLAGCP
jgi:DNA-binding beta-propeller fold protein YncE